MTLSHSLNRMLDLNGNVNKIANHSECLNFRGIEERLREVPRNVQMFKVSAVIKRISDKCSW